MWTDKHISARAYVPSVAKIETKVKTEIFNSEVQTYHIFYMHILLIIKLDVSYTTL